MPRCMHPEHVDAALLDFLAEPDEGTRPAQATAPAAARWRVARVRPA
jgi:hypothetical protein